MKLFKKLVALAATAAVAVCAMVAMPTDVKADTTKEVYLIVDEDGSYGLRAWDDNGVTFDGEIGTGDLDWVKVFTKVEDGVYKMNATVSDANAITGFSLKVADVADGVNGEYKAYTTTESWGVAGQMASWDALKAAFASSDAKIYLALDKTNWSITVTTAPSTGNGGSTGNSGSTGNGGATGNGGSTGSQDTADMAPVVAMVAVAALAAVVVLKKRTAKN